MANNTAKKLPAHKDPALQFKPGQSGNPAGRPKGSRNKLGEAFLKAMQEDFDKHGIAAIEAVRIEKPDAYVKVIASLLPKEAVVTHRSEIDDMSEEDLLERLRRLQSDIAPFLSGGNAGDRIAIEDHSGEGKPSSVH